MQIDTLLLGAYENNCYIVRKNQNSQDCIIIDTGLGTEPLMDFLRQNRLRPIAIILTHGHADHIAAVGAIRENWPQVKICIHQEDADMLNEPLMNLSGFAGVQITCKEPDVLLADGEKISYAGIELQVIHTPGHTPGGICLYSRKEAVLFSGDTLFDGSIGRTDFPGYDTDKCCRQLVESIKTRLLVLAEDTRVLPGHGAETTIGIEKKQNPYLS